MEATDGIADDTGQVCLPDGIFRYPSMAGRFLWLQERGRIVMVFGLVDTAGVRTTYGSPSFRDHVPDVDELLVTRIRAAGAILVGKTNTPEWGAGSHTFNPRIAFSASAPALSLIASSTTGSSAESSRHCTSGSGV